MGKLSDIRIGVQEKGCFDYYRLRGLLAKIWLEYIDVIVRACVRVCVCEGGREVGSERG